MEVLALFRPVFFLRGVGFYMILQFSTSYDSPRFLGRMSHAVVPSDIPLEGHVMSCTTRMSERPSKIIIICLSHFHHDKLTGVWDCVQRQELNLQLSNLSNLVV